MTSEIKLDEVKTKVDATKYYYQQCVGTAGSALVYSSIFFFIGVPLFIKKTHRYIPMRIENLSLLCVLSAAGASYWIGVKAKSICEERVLKEVGHLLD